MPATRISCLTGLELWTSREGVCGESEQGFHFRRGEEEAVARLAHHSEIATGIVFENDADVPDAFVVLFNAFDGCHLPAQRDVENVAAFFGMQAHAARQP